MLNYNSARVHVGGYVGGGTNENEEWLECKYEVVDGNVMAKQILPLRVRGTNTEGTIYKLDSFVLYPVTERAIVKVSTGRRVLTLSLTKAKDSHSSMFKLHL